MKKVICILFLIGFATACSTPCDQIIEFARGRYGEEINDKIISISDVFTFKWDAIYIFSPLSFPDDIQKAIGFQYEGEIVKDDNYLFVFTRDNTIVEKYTTSKMCMGFSDDDHTGVYKISYENPKYRIKCLGPDNYWLYKVEE